MASPIPHTWTVPAKFRERLGTQAGRQRAMLDDGHLLLVLHAPPDPEEPGRREGRFFWRAKDGAWKSTPGGGGLGALRAHLEEFASAAEKLEKQVEDARSAEQWFAVVRAASPLARTAKNLHKALQEAREGLPAEKELIALRDQAYDVERSADLIQEVAREGLEFTIARRTEEQAAQGQKMLLAAHRLNRIAAVFLPVSAIAGIMGMNLLPHGLEGFPPVVTFWGVTALAFVIGWWIRAGLPDPEGARSGR